MLTLNIHTEHVRDVVKIASNALPLDHDQHQAALHLAKHRLNQSQLIHADHTQHRNFHLHEYK